MNIEIARKNLASENPEIVIAGLKVLGDAGKLSDLQTVMALVKHNHSKVKQAATDATCSIIRENLLVHFHELDSAVREKLSFIMQSLDPAIIDEISKDLYIDDEDRRLRAVQVLGLLKKNPKTRDVLAKLVQDRDVKIRATAINLLGKIIGPNDQELILSLLNDEDKRVKANTIEALESLGNKRMVPVLLRFRRDPNNRIRGNVLKALHTLGYTEIESDLKEMIESQNNFMKASGLWVVSQIKFLSKTIEDGAGYCLLSDNEMVLINARKALQKLNSPRALGFMRYLDEFSLSGKT